MNPNGDAAGEECRLGLEQVLGDEALRQREFPVTAKSVYLAHAGVSPLPRRVADAMSIHLARAAEEDQEEAMGAAAIRRVRELAAALIGATAGEVALVGPTSTALSYVAAGLDWKPEDRVAVYPDDYPSNVYPWTALEDRGVKVDYIRAPSLGAIGLDQVAEQVRAETRLVALASSHFISGHRMDTALIGHWLRSRGVLFCVDAIQTLGAFPTLVDGVDFLAADAHKWLLGPCGAGLLYVRRELQDRVRPVVWGWHNVRNPDYVAQPRRELRTDARRYEAGTANLVGLAGLGASLDLIRTVGLEAISGELRRKRAWFVPELQSRGYTLLGPGAEAREAAGVTSVHRPGTDMADLHRRLAEAGIRASLRVDRSGRRFVRFSPHFYNTDAELERVLRVV